MSNMNDKKNFLSKKVLLDSLPYTDASHEDYEEYALALIEEEMKRKNTTDDGDGNDSKNDGATYTRPMKKLRSIKFRSAVMKHEYENLIDEREQKFIPRPVGRSFQPLKIVRPSNDVGRSPSSSSSSLKAEWKEIALPQAKTRLETERLRSIMLEVEKEEGVLNWKDYQTTLEHIEEQFKMSLQRQIDIVEEINYQRQQTQQQQMGPQLEELTGQYQQLLYQRNQTKHNIESLRRECQILLQKQGGGEVTLDS